MKLLAHAAYLVRYHAPGTLRQLYGAAPQAAAHPPTSVRNDQVFGLPSSKGLFPHFARAQRLLVAELPEATLAA